MSGKVYLIGAGPGDPQLMTLKAARALGLADVVLVDALVNRGCLAHARSDARIVEVGKRAGSGTSQAFIEKVMIQSARRTARPWRASKAATRSSSAAAARSCARCSRRASRSRSSPASPPASACRRCSASRSRTATSRTALPSSPATARDVDWEALVRSRTTLVIYMGLQNLSKHRRRRCRRQAWTRRTPACVVENGTLGTQRQVSPRLAQLSGTGFRRARRCIVDRRGRGPGTQKHPFTENGQGRMTQRRRHRQRHGRPALPREAGGARREPSRSPCSARSRVPAYDRVQLTSFFSGKTRRRPEPRATSSFFEKRDVTLRLNDQVLAIDPIEKVVRSARYRGGALRQAGVRHRLDALRAAGRGARPARLLRLPHDRGPRGDQRDRRALQGRHGDRRRPARPGSGQGAEGPRPRDPRGRVRLAPDGGAARRFRRPAAAQEDRSAGRHGSSSEEHEGNRRRRTIAGNRLVFADGTTLETDIVVFSAGIRPRDELARAAGLAVGERGGIRINSHCQTSNPDIYAVGECALWEGRIFGLVAPGYQMAEVAARHMAGETQVHFLGADLSTKLKLMGVDVASIGDAHARDAGRGELRLHRRGGLQEARGVGRPQAAPRRDPGRRRLRLRSAAAARAQPHAAARASGRPDPALHDKAKTGVGVDMLPDRALVCSCNSVSKGQICAAIAGGAKSLGALKKKTKAATSCGGCGPLAKAILDAEMKKRGYAVTNHLCEHFAHSRQELFHLVKVDRLQDFRRKSLQKHGRGRGCDICKPAVASILASCWNEMILEAEARAAAGHQRLLPRQPAEGRHLLDRAARAGRRDHARQADGARAGGEEVRPVHQDHRRAAHRPLRRARRAAAAGLARAGGRGLRVGPRLRQGAAHGEVLRRQHLVPLRRAGLGVDGDPRREPLPRPARAAQDQDGGVGLHARMRRGAGQGRRRDRHREGLEPLRVRQRRDEAAARRSSGNRSER